MTMLQPDFTMNDLAAQLRAVLGEADAAAMTSTELCKAIGRSARVVYRLLDELGDQVEVVYKQITNRTGIRQTVPAYRLRKRDINEPEPVAES